MKEEIKEGLAGVLESFLEFIEFLLENWIAVLAIIICGHFVV